MHQKVVPTNVTAHVMEAGAVPRIVIVVLVALAGASMRLIEADWPPVTSRKTVPPCSPLIVNSAPEVEPWQLA